MKDLKKCDECVKECKDKKESCSGYLPGYVFHPFRFLGFFKKGKIWVTSANSNRDEIELNGRLFRKKGRIGSKSYYSEE